MSQAEELLNSLDVSDASEESNTRFLKRKPSIVIGKDRFITVPDALKRLAVQYDHDIETVTFDCPRYWDEHDMSTMAIYVNYLCDDNESGCYKVKNVSVDPSDSTIMHFDWVISKNVTMTHGPIAFLVCIRNTDAEGVEKNHWNSEICKDCFISEGIEYDGGDINEIYPDILAQWRQEVLAITDDIVAAKENGELTGPPGVSPTIQITDIQAGHRVSITDAEGTKTFDVMDTIVDGTDAVNELLNRFVYISDIWPTTEPTLYFDTNTNDTEDGAFDYNIGAYMSYCNGGMSTVLYPRTRKDLVFGMDEIDNFVTANKGIVAHSDNGITYTATVPGITELTVGASFVMIPDAESSFVKPALNVNNLGEKGIRPRTTGRTGDFYREAVRSDWLTYNSPVRVTYNGNYWIADSIVVGAVDLAGYTEIVNGGTGATNIEQAAENLKFNSLACAVHRNDISNIDEEIAVGKYYFSKDQYYANWTDGTPNLPFVNNWIWCILTVEDAKGEGNIFKDVAEADDASVGTLFNFRQRIESDLGEKYYRMIEFNDGQHQYGGWHQEHTSTSPIILNDMSYGSSLPGTGVKGRLYFKKDDGCYIHNGTSWVKYF